MKASILAATLIAAMASVSMNTNAVRVCVDTTESEETCLSQICIPLSGCEETPPLPIPGHSLCGSYNEREACASINHVWLCWTGAQFACRTWAILGEHAVCIRWDDMAPSCFEITDIGDP